MCDGQSQPKYWVKSQTLWGQTSSTSTSTSPIYWFSSIDFHYTQISFNTTKEKVIHTQNLTIICPMHSLSTFNSNIHQI